MRLQKYIAHQGICSRRKAEELISLGKVKVNGEIVKEMGVQVDPDVDEVVVDAQPVVASKGSNTSPVYIVLHKPMGYVCSTTSSQGASVLELLVSENNRSPKYGRDITERVYPVGRLDKDSEGLVLLTNDGELTNTLTHPRYAHDKRYEVTLREPLSRDAKRVLSRGMDIGDGEFVRGIRIVDEQNIQTRKRGGAKRSVVTVVLQEGKNRQIKKMFGRLGYRVLGLKRTQMGSLRLGTLPIGKWKFVKKKDIVS